MEIGSSSESRAPIDVTRSLILVIALCTTLFMVTDYATMAAKFCYEVYSVVTIERR
ncbi:hypothetical protein MPTK1_4g00810 [Marchantia polymorpha subsp. ruderalis]|uniref:Uncharacterized protein n=1 Tax=Marchantia polymorpha subsp. ruderalis TaxID=1480154 RepID=A0AAF6B4Z5_MARPO|nr:hypothetical protein Mp_4g00810 [Marchantia polymorpha subsp. ruderalis]